MIKNGFLCVPVVDESEEPIFIPDGFKLSEIETNRTSYLVFKRSSEKVWEELYMYFYTKDFKVVVYSIEYTKEEVRKDFSHSIYAHEFSIFAQLRKFFNTDKTKLAKAS